MFAYSHVFVRVHSRLQDGQHCAISTIDSSGDALCLTVLGRDGAAFEGTFTEADTMVLKNQVELEWGPFFELFQKAFVERNLEFAPETATLRIHFKHDRPTESLPVAAFSSWVSVPLERMGPKPSDDGRKPVERATMGILDFIGLRNGDRREIERVDEICKRAEEARVEAGWVAQETAMLQAELDVATAQHDEAKKQYTELAKMLEECPATAGKWEAVIDAADTDRIVSRVPNAKAELAAPAPPDAFRNLLGAIKGRWPHTVMVTRPDHVAHSPEGHVQQPLANLMSGSGGGGTDAAPKSGRAPAAEAAAKYEVDDGEALTAHIRHNSYTGKIDAPEHQRMVSALSAPDMAVLSALDRLGYWEFNVLELESLCRNASGKYGALVFVAYAAMNRLGVCARFNLHETALVEYLIAVERGCNASNPFHNAMHAADVVATLFHFLTQGEAAWRIKLHDQDVLALLLAAIAVTHQHPGIDNAAVPANCYAALMYPGQSIVENHSIASAFALMSLQRYEFFPATHDVRADVQAQAARLVLATDPAKHAHITKVFRRFIDHWQTAASPSLDDMARDDVMLVLMVLFKAASVGFGAKDTQQYQAWVGRRSQEMKEAVKRGGGKLTAKEGEAHLNVLNYVVQPLYQLLTIIFPKLRPFGDMIAHNKQQWAEDCASTPFAV